MNPMQMNANRTARLVREATTPVYSTNTPTMAQRREALIVRAEAAACHDDYCFVCGRATDHFGEHDEAQILAWARTPRGITFLRRGIQR